VKTFKEVSQGTLEIVWLQDKVYTEQMINSIFVGTGFFLFGLLLHMLIWRISRPANTTRALALVFLLPIVAFFFLAVILLIGSSPEEWQTTIVDAGLAVALILGLSAAYIASYPAIENESPTLKIANLLHLHKKTGLSKEKLQALFSDEDLVRPSIKKLVNEGLIIDNGNSFTLTVRGKHLAISFTRFRKILRAEKGG
jgi:hypothetical protein